ncbi:hypothetical protein [Cohnella yongneupensis]|uniref:MarR family transcriptional regulator n=1 Tax=Cohnella yongneupensis TaxID=425006 RepID=A0ABW0R840_9BACL
MRLEMLDKDLTGTKKLLQVLWPVLGSFDDLVLEYEITSLSGVKIYADAYHRAWRAVFEAEGYASHAETITRDRFSFERMRIRTFTNLGYRFMPFSWDELDKRPEACRRSVYEMLGRFGSGGLGVMGARVRWTELSVYERELIRCAWLHNGSFGLPDVCMWLGLKEDATRLVVRKLEPKGLLLRVGGSARHAHRYKLTELAAQLS